MTKISSVDSDCWTFSKLVRNTLKSMDQHINCLLQMELNLFTFFTHTVQTEVLQCFCELHCGRDV